MLLALFWPSNFVTKIPNKVEKLPRIKSKDYHNFLKQKVVTCKKYLDILIFHNNVGIYTNKFIKADQEDFGATHLPRYTLDEVHFWSLNIFLINFSFIDATSKKGMKYLALKVITKLYYSI